jgi:hypothetical protein
MWEYDTEHMTERRPTSPTVLGCLAALASFAVSSVIAAATAPANRPKTIVDLQPFRTSESIAIHSRSLGQGTATLVNLNPVVGAWYVLEVTWNRGAPSDTYHLEVPRWPGLKLVLDERDPAGLLIIEGQKRYSCDLFGETSPDRLELARASTSIFQPICASRIYLRNPAAGRRTRFEATADFLRERVSGGETMLGFAHQVMRDWHLETGRVGTTGASAVAMRKRGPRPALVDPGELRRTIVSNNLGITVEGGGAGLVPGAWYTAAASPDVYVSLLQPNMIDAAILRDGEKSVNALDIVEASALTYLIAFDLDSFELAYAGGTNNPSVGWSAHMQAQMRDPRLPGPDGIGTIAPLTATGLVNPGDALRTVAAFAGGFKRVHGAFLFGELATKNRGSHYGFVEDGTVVSTLQPGLATIFALVDGSVAVKTWSDADNAQLQRIRFARQNGVPLVEFDERLRTTVPGRLVNQWGPGNWSGSEDRSLRTIRAAAALQENDGKRFLIYAVFSSATPSAMARVFQAYQCRYAMPLDMNALEHTYLALYQRTESGLTIEHLIKGMAEVDLKVGGVAVPRFIGYPDNRDFFYVMHRAQKAHS